MGGVKDQRFKVSPQRAVTHDSGKTLQGSKSVQWPFGFLPRIAVERVVKVFLGCKIFKHSNGLNK